MRNAGVDKATVDSLILEHADIWSPRALWLLCSPQVHDSMPDTPVRYNPRRQYDNQYKGDIRGYGDRLRCTRI